MKPTSITEIAARIAKLKARLIGDDAEGFCSHKLPLALAVDLEGNPQTAFSPCYCGKPRLIRMLIFCGHYPESSEKWEAIFQKVPPLVIAENCKVFTGIDATLI